MSDVTESLSSINVVSGLPDLSTALVKAGNTIFSESSGRRIGVPGVTLVVTTSVSEGDLSEGLQSLRSVTDEVMLPFFWLPILQLLMCLDSGCRAQRF